jgi:hypothetical protein
MQLNPFHWIRQQARAAFLAGIADACHDVKPTAPPELPAEARLLALPPAELPDPADDAPRKARR